MLAGLGWGYCVAKTTTVVDVCTALVWNFSLNAIWRPKLKLSTFESNVREYLSWFCRISFWWIADSSSVSTLLFALDSIITLNISIVYRIVTACIVWRFKYQTIPFRFVHFISNETQLRLEPNLLHERWKRAKYVVYRLHENSIEENRPLDEIWRCYCRAISSAYSDGSTIHI